MLNQVKKANLTFVLLLIISLCLSGNVKAAPEDSGLYRASFTKKSPSNNATGVTVSQPKLEWNSASGVFRYFYCYYSPDITNNVCNIDDKATWKSNGTSTSVQLPNLVPNKKYYWQVGAKLNDNSFIYADGALTSKWSFTTGSAPSVGEGLYDNTHSNWTYTGKWATSTYTGTETGPYNKTYKESGDIPDYATFTFTGSRVSLYYIQEPERGVMNIYMDNSTTPIALDQSGPLTWQKMWMSGALASGTHTIKLVYVSGNSVNIDAIQIFAQADTTAPAAINLSAVSGTNAGTAALNWTAVGDDGNTAGGAATMYLVRYSTSPILTQGDWDNATVVSSGIPTPKTQGQAETMTVAGLIPGQTYYFAARAQDEQFNMGAISNSPSATAYLPPPASPGKYDDTHSSWAYMGNWITWSGTGPYNNTMHYTNAANTKATFRFQAPAKFMLFFQASGNRSNILVSVDGGAATPVNAYSASTVWQQTYTSAMYSDTDIHTVTISTPGDGKYIDIDAIQIIGPPTPQGAGIYDDADFTWTYTGNWSTWNGTGPLNNTMHYTNATGASASFMFQAPAKFILTFSKNSNRSNIMVAVDGGAPVLVDAYSSTGSWKHTYTSATYLDTSSHTVTVSTPGDGKYIDIDAIQIVVPTDITPPAAISNLNAATGTATGSVRLTWTAVGDSDMTGTASSYLVRYSTSAISDEAAWNAATPVTTGIPTPVAPNGAQNMTITGLLPGMTYHFAVRALDEEPNVGGISNPASAAAKLPAPVGVGKYDDTAAAWVYTGSWSTWSGTGPYNNTMHYANAPGATAVFTFQAPARFILTYSMNSNRSDILVSVDGGATTLVGAYSASTVWQQTYTSAMYSDTGSHTVMISTPGDGSYIDIDAIEIAGPPTAHGPGTYDDAHSAWTYTGNWATWSGTGPLHDTMHYTNATGATATFTFQGPARFTLFFQATANRSDILVSVNGGTPILVDAYSTTSAWRQTYISDIYPDTDSYTVTISTPGDGSYIDIDAITIETPTVLEGVVPYIQANSILAHLGRSAWNSTSMSFPFQISVRLQLPFQTTANRINFVDLIPVDTSKRNTV